MLTSLECDNTEYLGSLMNSQGSMRRRYRSGNSLRRSSLFSLYAKIFRLLLGKWDKADGDLDENIEEDDYSRELDSLVLPSNEDWRLRVYYRLVELQRDHDHAEADYDATEEMAMNSIEEPKVKQRVGKRPREIARRKKWDWEPDTRIIYPLTPRSSRRLDSFDSSSSIMLEACVEPGWRLKDILLAAKLLMESREPEDYADEAEMRRVYGLVYDVLRYKQILDRALDDVGFWIRYEYLKRREKIVWLLLYDMQGRKFARIGNSAAVALRNEALREAGLLDVEKALLDTKTRLAASLSRLRIGGSALSLDELLPAHLRTAEGVTWGEEGAIASGWVNSAKLPTRQQFVEEMRKIGLTLCSDCSPASELEEDQYVFDPLCPKVVNLHEKARERLAVSQLVRTHGFVFLERSLCVGAAALVHAIRVGKLCGPVILTHSLAPRHTGYLAELLADVEEAGRLLAFGLGDSRSQHQAYLEKLGISLQRCKLFSERYTSAPSSAEVERATIVLATPPCSYTGVRDVVDLAIARGGDLRLLESLTSLEAESPQQPRALLNEQMATLRYALTRPNVQLLVYEVHTLLPSETTEMMEQAVEHANRMALDKFRRDHPQRKKSPPRETTGKKSKGKRSQSLEHIAKAQQDDTKSNLESEDDARELPIPESDLFEMSDLNDLYQQDCSKLTDQGSYIVVVKRKEMMQFNSLFMIKVAEAKGVFGEPTKQQPSPPPKTPEPQQTVPPTADTSHTNRKIRRRGKIQFERITAPTHSSIIRALRAKQPCPRHQQHVVQEESSIESQNTTSSEPLITPPLSPTVKKSAPNIHIELTSITDTNKDDEELKDEVVEKIISYTEPKYENLGLINADIEDVDEVSPGAFSDEIVESKDEMRDVLHANDSFNQSTHSPSPTHFYDSYEFGKHLDKMCYLSKKSSTNNLEPLKKYIDEKGEGMFFNISLKPTMHLQSRRQMFPRKRLHRIPFQSRLETVLEQSQGFSYLFPEE